MLQNIREKTSGWIAYVIIGLISIPFVLAGITSYFGGGSLAPAAIVDGEEISSQLLDFSYRNYQQRLMQIFGGSIPPGFDNETVLKEQVRDQLISEQVLSKYVEDQNFRYGNESLNLKITEMSVFQVEGKFDQETYQAQLRSQGRSTVQFEEELRKSEEMTQVRRAISGTQISSSKRQKDKQNLALQERQVNSLLLPIDVDSVSLSDEEINKEYETNSDRYMTSERVKIDFLDLNLETIKETITVSDEQLREYYEEVKEDLIAAETRETSHILLQLNEDASDELVSEKKTLALDLKQQVINGASFADLAKAHSDDPGSAQEGGSLGQVEKGMMVEAFEDALFVMNVGDVSDPVKTPFGWHIIQLNAIAGGEVPTFESKSFELAEQLKTEQAESKFYEFSEQLSNVTYEQVDSLVPAAELLNLTIKTSDWFERAKGEGVAENAKIREIAFSSAVLLDGQNSEAIELSPNNLVVIRLNTHEPSILPPLDDIKDKLLSVLKVQKARVQTAEKGKKGVEQAKSEGLAAVASLWNQAVKSTGFIQRDSKEDDASIVELAFKMPKPNGSSNFQGIELASGDYAIVEVTDLRVVQGESEESNVSPAAANYEYQTWLNDKVSNADVVKTPLAELQ